jgi:hypothetical protein
MSTARIRQLKAARLRQQLAEDPAARTALAALDAVDAATSDLAARREALTASGRFTPAGVHGELADFRKQHASALRKAADNLRTSAERLAASSALKIELPQDAQRILDHYLAAPPAKQRELKLAALSGRDEDLARVLVHPSNARYTELAPELRSHIEARYSDPAAAEANAPRMEVYVLANDVLTDALRELEVE